MTVEEEALVTIARLLEQLEIPHMVTGSVASSFHGRPRSTHDADIVIDPDPRQLAALVDRLGESGFYVDGDHARDALRRRLQFNAIDRQSAFKIDLIIRKDRPFSREEMARRGPAELWTGQTVAMASVEDTILAKLEWAKKAGRSQKQLDDVSGILAVRHGLDRDYIEKWAAALGVLDLWREIGK